jgi:hypothetical protein
VNAGASSYDAARQARLSVGVAGAGVSLDLRERVSSGLMTFFFFVFGLEARREFDIGQLRERRRLARPVLAGPGACAASPHLFPGRAPDWRRWRRQVRIGRPAGVQGQQVDPVAGPELDAGLGVAQGTVVLDRYGYPAGRPGSVAEPAARSRGAVPDGHLHKLVARQGGTGLGGEIGRSAGGQRTGAAGGRLGRGDLPGERAEHVAAGNPAQRGLPAGIGHGHPVAAVDG